MNLIAKYATQEVTLKRKTGEDTQYHEVTYADPETIMAVYEPASGTVTTSSGNVVQVESIVKTDTEVAMGDLVEGSVVKRVIPIIYFSGEIIGYEAFL